MDNIGLLLQNNYGADEPMVIGGQAYVWFQCGGEYVTKKTLKNLIIRIKDARRRYLTRIPVIIDLNGITFEDKLAIVLLECICYLMITEYKYPVKIVGIEQGNIDTEGIESSPLKLLNTEKDNRREYCEKFEREIYGKHYRKFISVSEVKSGKISLVMQDIQTFLKHLSVEREYREKISEVIVELVGNAGEHGNSSCLIDIDVTGGYHKKNDSSESIYRGLNVVIVSFSKCLFYEKIREKIKSIDESRMGKRYVRVKKAFDVHKKFFSEKYTEEDFFTIAAYQDSISGRFDSSQAGGKGLTVLLHSLEERADAHRCYMISGERGLVFLKDLLDFDSDMWIGFNEEKSFFDAPPDQSVLFESDIYIPGTAYNLCFVMKGAGKDE